MGNKEVIKCCPFCGSHKVDICRTNENACWIECTACGAQTSSDPTRDGAITNWNQRHSDDLPAEIDMDDDKDFR